MISQLDNPVYMIQRIQSGDEGMREQFLESSIPFIKRAVRHFTHSFYVEQEDEFGIALEAYNQAIDHFKTEGAVPFEPYALLLIKHRLLDWIRRQKYERHNLSLNEQDHTEGLTLEDRLADPRSEIIQQDLEFTDSIAQLEIQLHGFGMSLSNLADHFPKHQDSRRLCIRLARQLSADQDLFEHLMQSHRLPCVELSHRCEIPLKTIEKHRSSIILLTLLMRSELQIINAYISVYEKGCSK